MFSKMELIKKTYHRSGLESAIHLSINTLLNKFISFKKLKILIITSMNEESLKIDSRFHHGFLDGTYLKKLSIDSGNELSSSFVESALQKKDECYALTSKDELASYGWYSNRETLTDIHKLKFSFDPSYMYMYKGFTKENYRGHKLHAVGMNWALKKYLDKGYRGLVSYVESTNFDSLKSCYRLGYKDCGSIIVMKIFGKIIKWGHPSLEQYKVKLI